MSPIANRTAHIKRQHFPTATIVRVLETKQPRADEMFIFRPNERFQLPNLQDALRSGDRPRDNAA